MLDSNKIFICISKTFLNFTKITKFPKLVIFGWICKNGQCALGQIFKVNIATVTCCKKAKANQKKNALRTRPLGDCVNNLSTVCTPCFELADKYAPPKTSLKTSWFSNSNLTDLNNNTKSNWRKNKITVGYIKSFSDKYEVKTIKNWLKCAKKNWSDVVES